MDRNKRKVKEEGTTMTEIAAAAIVTPPRKKSKSLRNNECEPSSTGSMNSKQLEGKLKDDAVDVTNEEDKKPLPTEGSTESEDNSSGSIINGDTVLEFDRFPTKSNKIIMLENYDFVRWAQRQTNPHDKLKAFVTWSHTKEAKALQLEGMGKEEFTFGQHKGETFAQILESDPEYHERYMYMLKKRGKSPPETLSHYMDYAKKCSKQKERKSAEGRKNNRVSAAAFVARRQRSRTSRSSRGAAADNVFTFGRYEGRTFWEVAKFDPSYHLRCKDMNYDPNGDLDEYIEWFDEFAPTRFEAHHAHRDKIFASFDPCYNCY